MSIHWIDKRLGWVGQLLGGREGGHDVSAHISSHTVWLRAQGVCVSLHQYCSLSNNKQKCVWLCVTLRAQSSRAVNAAD